MSVSTNGAALKNGYKLIVSEAGIQEVLFSAIGGVTDTSKLRLTHRGQDVAIHVLADRLRFYAAGRGRPLEHDFGLSAGEGRWRATHGNSGRRPIRRDRPGL